MKAGESQPDQGRDARLSCPGSMVPSPKIAADGAPQGDALPEFHRLASDAGSEMIQRCASRRSMPLVL
jgi:hypothetical protein